jgi:hypothetical protein
MINLSQIWKEKGQPKLFTIEGNGGLFSVIADMNWLPTSGITHLGGETVKKSWGVKYIQDSYALGHLSDRLVNDTEFLRHNSITPDLKEEFEETLREYKLRESLKITVLVA